MSEQEKRIAILAFYVITPIEEPQREVKRIKNFLKQLDAKARIYVSEEGVNAQMSIAQSDKEVFTSWFLATPAYAGTPIKEHSHHEHVFPRLTVKYRKQIVAFDQKVDFSQRGSHIKPADWKAMMEENDPNTVILDVRNDYEWEVGHFENSINSNCKTFREFDEFASNLKKERDPSKTRVMMFCTGGIRCEYFSPFLKKQGFDEIYQLDGGVIQYGLDVGSDKWEGGLFVFDDRLVVPLKEGQSIKDIGKCHKCGVKTSVFYNCANMDCNDLFLSCLECAKQLNGCCSKTCQKEGRLRPFDPSATPKPFNRLTADEKERLQKAASALVC